MSMDLKKLALSASIAVLGISALLGTSRPAAASLTVVNSRSAFDSLGSHVSVDWGIYGPDGTTISTPAFETVGGLTLHVASSQGILARHDEGVSFTGNFAPGAHLLTDAGSESDSFIVGFDSTTVRGFGMQVEPHYIRGPWTGDIQVFDASNVLLGDIAVGGTATDAEDNSAPFYGIVSSSADISYWTFTVNQPSPLLPAGAVAINTMDVLVPEPSSLTLFGAAIFALAGFVAMRRRTTTD